MNLINYEDYINIIPKETKEFINFLIYVLHCKNKAEIRGRLIHEKIDFLLFSALNVYGKISEKNKSAMTSLGFDIDLNYYDEPGEYSKAKVFNDYYKFFVPYETEEEYVTATPEDIILGIYYSNEYRNEDDRQAALLINGGLSDFLSGLRDISKEKKNSIIEDLENYYFTSCDISTENYLRTVSILYSYIKDEYDSLLTMKMTDDNLKAIAYTLGLFYYNNVDNFDEKKVIVDYFNKLKMSDKIIEKTLDIDIIVNNITKYSSIALLKSKLNIDLINDLTDKSVGNVYYEMVNQTNKENTSFKHLFGIFNNSVESVLKFKDVLDAKKEENNGALYEDIYSGVLPNTIKLYDRLCQIYSYLSDYNNINEYYIKTNKDYVTLSLLISNYLDNDSISIFLNDKGISLDAILKELNLPKKEKLINDINNTEVDRTFISRFNYIISEGMCSNISKSELSPKNIYSNLYNPDYSKSSLIHNLYYNFTNEILPQAYKYLVDRNDKLREEDRINTLKEKLFKDVPIDVYNYLNIVYSYYCIFKNKKLSKEDAKQLSIIYAACRYDEKIRACLAHNGLTRKNLTNFFDLDYSYESTELNIDELEKEFRKYIFDRDPEKISVYSIFNNAFDPKLTNSVELRQALFEMNKKPEDFIDLEKLMQEYDKYLLEEKKHSEVSHSFTRFKEPARSLMKDVLKIYYYLINNVKSNKYLQTYNDYKEMAMLIACLDDHYDSSKYLKMNGITQDYVLSLIGLTREDLDNIYYSENRNDLITEFKNYYDGSKYIDKSAIIHYVFNEDNSLMRKITKSLGTNYDLVRDSVINKKEKKVTPEEGINMLQKEEILPVEVENISSIASYGEVLSKHSKFINDSLHELMFKDSIDESIQDVNTALSSVVQEERINVEQSFWQLMFSSKPAVKVVKKYNPEKVGDLQDAINSQLETLTKELQGYEYIEKYIELYLSKLNDQLEELKKSNDSIDVSNTNVDDIEGFTKALNNKTRKEMISSKISTLETMIVVMKQELLSVHRAMLNHFITINSLHTSKNAILPVLASEMIINRGNKSESEAIELTNNLIGLLQSVVNKNVDSTRENLEKLKVSSISTESFEALNKEIKLYLEDIDKKSKLLEEPKEEYIGPVLKTPVVTSIKIPLDPKVEEPEVNEDEYLDLLSQGQPLPPIQRTRRRKRPKPISTNKTS